MSMQPNAKVSFDARRSFRFLNKNFYLQKEQDHSSVERAKCSIIGEDRNFLTFISAVYALESLSENPSAIIESVLNLIQYSLSGTTL